MVSALSEIPGVDVYVSAPNGNRSATSHCLTLRVPVLIDEAQVEGAVYAEKLSGQPADCVKSALKRLPAERGVKIDAVFAGVNHGSNIGDDVYYSGTIGAAAEGIFAGIPAVAFSVGNHNPSMAELENTRTLIKEVAQKIVPTMDGTMLLNVNFPNCMPEEIKGMKVTRLGPREYDERYEVMQNHRGQKYFWYQGDMVMYQGLPEDVDVMADQAGYVTLTPVRFRMTYDEKMAELEKFDLKF